MFYFYIAFSDNYEFFVFVLKARRLRFAMFPLLADLPLRCPHLNIAFVKWSHRQPPKFGYCPIPENGKIKSLSDPTVNGRRRFEIHAH